MSIMKGTDEGRLTCGDPFCNPGDSCCIVRIRTHCSRNPQAVGWAVFTLPQAVPAEEILCYIFQFEVLKSVLIFKALSARHFPWDHKEATVESALLERFLSIYLLRWSTTTGFAHPALGSACQSFLEVFGHDVNYN